MLLTAFRYRNPRAVLIGMDRFIESDHPRDDIGRFTSGGDSRGAPPEAAKDTQAPGFKKFFAGSKITNKNGEPLALFHGTVNEFDKFDFAHGGSNTGEQYHGTENAFFFTPTRSETNLYIEIGQERQKGAEGRVLRSYVNAKNPLVLGGDGESSVSDEMRDELIDNDGEAIKYAQANGYDAVVWTNGNRVNSGYTVAALSPDQVWIAGVENTKGKQVSGRSEKPAKKSDDPADIKAIKEVIDGDLYGGPAFRALVAKGYVDEDSGLPTKKGMTFARKHYDDL